MSMAVISPLMIHWSYRDAQLRTLLSNPESSASGRVFGYNPKWTLAIHIGTIVGTPPAIIGIAEVGTARTALFQNFIVFLYFMRCASLPAMIDIQRTPPGPVHAGGLPGSGTLDTHSNHCAALPR